MIWNNQDTNLSWYVPKANVDHTISGQATADSTLDHSATTPIMQYIAQTQYVYDILSLVYTIWPVAALTRIRLIYL